MSLHVHIPASPLCEFVSALIYYDSIDPIHEMDRFLPDGNTEIIINLHDQPQYMYDNETLKKVQTCRYAWVSGVRTQPITIPVGGKCASLAAQVAHVTYYLDVLERYVVHNDRTPADWGYIWRTVEKVTPEEWDDYKRQLKDSYQRVEKMFRENPVWNDDSIGGAMAIVVHTAYHLGEIRQALCTMKS